MFCGVGGRVWAAVGFGPAGRWRGWFKMEELGQSEEIAEALLLDRLVCRTSYWSWSHSRHTHYHYHPSIVCEITLPSPCRFLLSHSEMFK